jgi:ABC-type polysaccharide/polyol phosphate export permease
MANNIDSCWLYIHLHTIYLLYDILYHQYMIYFFLSQFFRGSNISWLLLLFYLLSLFLCFSI